MDRLHRARAAMGAVLLVAALANGCSRGPARGAAPPIPDAGLIQVADLAQVLAGPREQPPSLLHVGYEVLYRSGHIPGSQYVGAGSTAEGQEALREAVQALPPDRPIVVYCGCCPWADCPNMRPAYATVASLGRQVKALYVPTHLQKDWIDKGLPASKVDR